MGKTPRVIIYAEPDDYILAARVAKRLSAPDYEWPADGIASIAFQRPGDQPWEGRHFGCRRNKAGFTIYGPARSLDEGAA